MQKEVVDAERVLMCDTLIVSRMGLDLLCYFDTVLLTLT